MVGWGEVMGIGIEGWFRVGSTVGKYQACPRHRWLGGSSEISIAPQPISVRGGGMRLGHRLAIGAASLYPNRVDVGIAFQTRSVDERPNPTRARRHPCNQQRRKMNVS